MKVKWNGILYETVAKAAQALGLSEQGVRYRMSKEWLSDSDVSSTRRGSPPQTVVWDGIVFPSMKDAAKTIGISEGALRDRIRRGKTKSDDVHPQRSWVTYPQKNN